MRSILTLAMALAGLAGIVPTLSPAQADDKGFTLLLDRQTYTLEHDGQWVGLFENERRADDAEAARNGGRIDISYQASLQTLEIVEAETIKADGRHLPVARDKIIDIAPHAARDVTLYTDLRTRSIVFPDVEAGDAIHYVYRLTRFDHVWPGFFWEFAWQPAVRVELAERILDHPAAVRVAVEADRTAHRVETRGDRVRHVLSWSNRTPTDPEPGTTSSLDWGPHAVLSTYSSYAEIGELYARLHRDAAHVTPEIKALADTIAGETNDPRETARLLYDWVASNIRYVGVAIGQAKLTPT
jgi:transglutaminase-like putative cysteine protease